MAAFNDLSDLINRMTGGNSGNPENIFLCIDNRIDSAAATATVVGKWSSLWRYNKSRGGSGAVPTSAAAPDNATRGGLMQADPSGGQEKWLLGQGCFASIAGAVMLYDRLLHNGGLVGTSVAAQTVGGTLTRNTGGEGNQIWVEIYTAIGTTATTITASYTNQAGVSGRTTKPIAIGGTGNREGERMLPLPLQDGDTGVQAVASVTLAGSTVTSGNFGVTVLKPLGIGMLPSSGIGFWRDYVAGLPGLPKIDTDACLALAMLCNATTAPQICYAAGFAER
ncbi:MAG: hypothetical protein SFX19_01500 [Alphaproteobacteria bacterium]|nr:hypothetical protein [Alphaproteobacteria bacterium]